MAKLPSVFKAEDHESMSDFSPIPIGLDTEHGKDKYLSQIVHTDVVPTKAAKEAINDGDATSEVAKARILKIQEKILSGDYKGKIVFVNLNIVNPNPTAVEIANKELRSICDAVGKANITMSEELQGIPHYITLGMTEASAQHPAKNKVTKYEPADDGVKTAAPDENPFEDDDLAEPADD